MRRIDLFFTTLLIPLDYIMLLLAAIVGYSLRFSRALRSIRDVTFDLPLSDYLSVISIFAILFLFIFAFSGLYNIRQSRLAIEFIRIGLAISTGMGLVLMIAFFSRELFESRFIFLAVWLLSIFFISLGRFIIRIIRRKLRKKGVGLRKTVIIGESFEANELQSYFKLRPQMGYSIVAHYRKFSHDVKTAIFKKRRKGNVDTIILADNTMTRDQIDEMKSFADNEQISFQYCASLFPAGSMHPIIHTFAGHPVVEIPKTPLVGWGAIYKRIFDIICSALLIILTLPIQIMAAIAITFESKGGVLFSHLPDGSKTMRIGRFGIPFHYIKFRSMEADRHFERYEELSELDTREGALVKIKNDPRITKVGKFIRRFSIDELPELWLVLIGKMSLVGPRPHLPEEVDMYEPHQRRVLTIKPGITGMAQVSGRANLRFEDEVALDMHYIQTWSPVLDIIILLKTPHAVFFPKGNF